MVCATRSIPRTAVDPRTERSGKRGGTGVFDDGVVVLGLATAIWAILMIANRRLGPSQTLRKVLYGAGVLIFGYAVARLAGWV